MPLTVKTERDRQWVTVTVPANTRWVRFQEFVLATVETSPDLVDWNWIIDDQQPMDDVDAAGMSQIGAAFRRLASDPERRTFTVVVTSDPFFPTWARVIDMNYGARRHHAAPSLAAARTLMQTLEAREA